MPHSLPSVLASFPPSILKKQSISTAGDLSSGEKERRRRRAGGAGGFPKDNVVLVRVPSPSPSFCLSLSVRSVVLNGIKKCTEHADDADAPESEEHLAASRLCSAVPSDRGRKRRGFRATDTRRKSLSCLALPLVWIKVKVLGCLETHGYGHWARMGLPIGPVSFDHLV